jgi:urease accessory protein
VESELAELRLLHLADSALPIGGLAHSFGLETLVATGLVGVGELREFFGVWLEEAGFLEAVYCRAGFRLATNALNDGGDEAFAAFATKWLTLNEALSARKAARESRAASGSLGRNFLTAVSGLDLSDGEARLDPARNRLMQAALVASKRAQGLIHHSVAFGFVGGVLGFAEVRVALAFLHSCGASLVSACQRLMPLGQNAATRLLWELKPAVVEAARRSAECGVEDAGCFMPILEWGAMEHPGLETRLFIS